MESSAKQVYYLIKAISEFCSDAEISYSENAVSMKSNAVDFENIGALSEAIGLADSVTVCQENGKAKIVFEFGKEATDDVREENVVTEFHVDYLSPEDSNRLSADLENFEIASKKNSQMNLKRVRDVLNSFYILKTISGSCSDDTEISYEFSKLLDGSGEIKIVASSIKYSDMALLKEAIWRATNMDVNPRTDGRVETNIAFWND